MASNNRLKLKRKDVEKLFKEGKKIWVEDILLILCLPNNLGCRRFTVIASRKVGKAVKRNRVKRLLREFFRRNENIFPASTDFILVASPKILNFKYPELEEKLKSKLAHEFSYVGF